MAAANRVGAVPVETVLANADFTWLETMLTRTGCSEVVLHRGLAAEEFVPDDLEPNVYPCSYFAVVGNWCSGLFAARWFYQRTARPWCGALRVWVPGTSRCIG